MTRIEAALGRIARDAQTASTRRLRDAYQRVLERAAAGRQFVIYGAALRRPLFGKPYVRRGVKGAYVAITIPPDGGVPEVIAYDEHVFMFGTPFDIDSPEGIAVVDYFFGEEEPERFRFLRFGS